MFKKILKNKKGITLLELTVAIAIFIAMMLSVTQIFKMVIDGQRNAIAGQNLQENMRYALEVMSKEIRMAQKEDHSYGDCPLIADNKVYEALGGGNGILVFKNYNDECVAYSVSGSRLEIIRYPVDDQSLVTTGYITPDEIKVLDLEFTVIDDVDNTQSMVTMRMDVEAVGQEMHKQSMKIQTTISSRHYE